MKQRFSNDETVATWSRKTVRTLTIEIKEDGATQPSPEFLSGVVEVSFRRGGTESITTHLCQVVGDSYAK